MTSTPSAPTGPPSSTGVWCRGCSGPAPTGTFRSSCSAAGYRAIADSGVRSGTEVVKALALGATAVGIGRPYAYGAALGGTDGYPTVADLGPDAIRRC